MRRELAEAVSAFGQNHPRALTARANLADAYYHERDFLRAFPLMEEVLDVITRQVGADASVTLSMLTQLARIWFGGWRADRLAERAIPLFEFAVTERIRVTGPVDPHTLDARNSLATAYLAAGQVWRALAGFEAALGDCTRVLGEADELTRAVRDNRDAVRKLGSALDPVPGRDKDDATLARELPAAFAGTLGLEADAAGGRLSVTVPAIGDTLRVPVCDVKRVTRSFAPTGDPALELAMLDGDSVRPLIVLPGNVIFEPEDPVTVLMAPVPVRIGNAPTLISYAEMVDGAERFARAAAAGDAPDPGLAGTCLLLRCVIAGAVRFGMRPLTAVGWWQRGWAAHAEWDLPPFPPDPVWNHLVRSASGIVLGSATRTARDAASGELTVADFEALRPRLSVSQPDEEFVGIWTTWIPVAPDRFADLILEGLDGARARVALYPEGAGRVDLIIGEDGDTRGFLQVRFDIAASEMTIGEVRLADEARGSGLFQRLQHNTEQLARALGLSELHVLATGMGGYAFARAGWPQDRELFARANPSAR